MSDKRDEALKTSLEAAYLAGFNNSAEGYNGEYPFRDNDATPTEDRHWIDRRDEYIRYALSEQSAQQEPVDFTSLLSEAEEIVRGKPTWKRFIDGTPLSNDIAVWMAVFAQDVARRTSPPASKPWIGLTDEEAEDIWNCYCDEMGEASINDAPDIARAIEAKLREKNA